MLIGVVAEGPTDFLVLQSVIQAVLPGSEVWFIQPSVPLNAFGAGWRGVKNWCTEFRGEDLDLFMRET